MALQNSQREIQEAGLRTPYIFTSNQGGIKLAYCGYSYVNEKVLRNGNVAGQAPKQPRKDQVRKNMDYAQ